MKLQHAIEVVETGEVKQAGQRPLALWLTAREQAYCAWHKHRRWEHVAARVAAKRALRKILSQAQWLEMEIHKEEGGRPFFQFTGKTQALLKKKKIKKVCLSLSHTTEEAIASIITSS